MPFTEKSRKLRMYFYGLMIAAGPLVTFYGLASAEEVALWLGFGGMALGIPAGAVALANLNPKAAKLTTEADLDPTPTAELDAVTGQDEAEPVLPTGKFITDEMEGKPGTLAEQQRDVDEDGLARDRAAHAGDVDLGYGDLELQIEADDRAAFPLAEEKVDDRSEDTEHYGEFDDVTEDDRPDDTEHYDQFEDVTESRGRRAAD